MRKMLQLLLFGFHKIPYKLEIIKNYLSKNNETYRADSLSDMDSKTINCIEGMSQFSGENGLKIRENGPKTGNSFVMSIMKL